MFKRSLAAGGAIILLTAGCSFGRNGGDGGDASAAQADGVTPEALQAAVQDEPVRRFYEARGWQSAWSPEAGEQLKASLQQNAVRHALDSKTFMEGVNGGSPAQREVALTRAALTYAGTLAHGRTDPAELFDVYTLPRNQVDVPAGLAQAVQQGNAPQWIESLAPQDEEYRALSQAFVQHLQATRQQAGQNRPQPQQKGGPPDAKAKERQQAKQDSAAPAEPRDRAVVLAVNLERRRWLARQPEANRIDVNTAGTFLRYIRDNQVADQRVVVVGEPGWETPQLGSPMFRLVANPDWTVPESIEKDELAGLSPAQLQRKNMKRVGERIVQQPGPDNALGQVKFDMRNDHAIYLHDTPAKAFFARDRRHLSHGCVRVSDAVGFARMLAQHYGKLDAFNQALAGGSAGEGQQSQPQQRGRNGDPVPKTTFVDLPQQIPVRLLYHTAFLDGGQLRIAPDPYGWDARVAQALGLPVPPASARAERTAEQKRAERGDDIGP